MQFGNECDHCMSMLLFVAKKCDIYYSHSLFVIYSLQSSAIYFIAKWLIVGNYLLELLSLLPITQIIEMYALI